MNNLIDLDARRKKRTGNGAREAIIDWPDGPPAILPPEDFFGKQEFSEITADSLLAYLWLQGYKIVPLDGDNNCA